ncbi:hypothetical protein R6U76_23140 [Lysinibacillus capsici]|uniref:hypothetical protein n=1 Tax=Lysinibacillus capsici TaxID=2115968 RepID=UPI0029DE7831|nr:hypothetical protein [Lysinibacillus capsici]WPK05468.1 hypothetical protein R6U76_23140 [Lysinibacillus capsici]
MVLNQRQITSVKIAFESILRSDYISLDQIDQLNNLERYYVDFYNNISNLLQQQDNYINGRRGTGKTSLLMRGYLECIKTLIPSKFGHSEYFYNEKVLPVFIDLSKCRDIFYKENNEDSIEMNFILQIIEALKKQLEIIFNPIELRELKKDSTAFQELDYIENILLNALKVEQQSNNTNMLNDINQLSLEISEKLNVQNFLDKINNIRIKAGIHKIYVFIDEFSDLSDEEQSNFSILFQKFLGSKVNMFFKIGVITDRYNFGPKIRIGRDIYPISLDLNDFVERYGGTVVAVRKMQEFVEMILNKRLEIFCSEVRYIDIFKISKENLCQRLARQSLGVPRTLGLILQHAWNQAQNGIESDNKIGLSEINYGIRTVRKMYYKQFEGSIKKNLIPSFYLNMWKELVNRALNEKEKNNERPSSHFMIDPLRKEYLNIFCENFLVHLLEEDRASKYGGNYYLYVLDYGVCLENNIKYAEEKDEFTAVRFIYDSVLLNYDPYFLTGNQKSYKCSTCGCIYEENEVAKFKVKRCFEDDTVLEEIQARVQPTTKGNYTELEIKILGLISALDKGEAMTASEIADTVGCSRQKVSAWATRVLERNGKVSIINIKGKNYYYSLDEKEDVICE